MAALFSTPKAPAPPPVPTVVDNSVQQAASNQAIAGALAVGQGSTLLTSGQGVQTPATVAKKVLLGG